MSELETTHNEFRAVYREGRNIWECPELELEAPSLKALRDKINAADAEMRRVDNLPVLYMSSSSTYSGDLGIKPAVITLMDGAQCWIARTGKLAGAWDKKRQKVKVESLLLDTPEARKQLQEINVLRALAEEARRKTQEACDALLKAHRLTPEEVERIKLDMADKAAGGEE